MNKSDDDDVHFCTFFSEMTEIVRVLQPPIA